MTVLPEPVPLDPPPGDPTALADLVESVTGAAFRVGVLHAHLAGPAASAPGWLGADGAAAAEQVAAVAALTGTVHAAVTEAVNRLGGHLDLLFDSRARIRALRAAQEQDLVSAAARLTVIGDPVEQSGIVADLAAAEAARRREHAALLAEVAADAAATAAVLARSTVPVGGAGRRGDADRVVASLATLLPGWGDGELTALGRAAGLEARRSSTDEVEDLLRRSSALLGRPEFAAAYLSALGADAFLDLVRVAGLPGRSQRLTGPLATVMAAALPATTAVGANRELSGLLDAPLTEPLEATIAVALGRLAGTGALPSSYLARVVRVLTTGERANPGLRRDELAVAPAEDPLAEALGALASTGDADTAARTLAAADLWPSLLGREWTEGTGGLDRLIVLAGESADGDQVVRAVLGAVGAVVEPVVMGVGTGTPEAFTLAAISPAVGHLVAAHLSVVTDTVAVGLSRDGVPSRPLDAAERRLLAGLGMVTLDPSGREAVLRALVDATAAAAPAVGPGAQATAAYAHGGVFAAMAFGEAQDIRHRLWSAVAIAENRALCWDVVTAPLGMLRVSRFKKLFEVATTGLTFVGPGGVPLGEFLHEPATGAPQAAFSAVVASLPRLVDAGLLPHPGTALDQGLGSPEGRRYEADLGLTEDAGRPAARDVWDEVVSAAEGGYLDVGDSLGFLPGSG